MLKSYDFNRMFKMENKMLWNNNRKHYYFENIICTQLEPSPVSIIIHLKAIINAFFHLAYCLVGFFLFLQGFQDSHSQWPYSVIIHCQSTRFPCHCGTIAHLYYQFWLFGDFLVYGTTVNNFVNLWWPFYLLHHVFWYVAQAP